MIQSAEGLEKEIQQLKEVDKEIQELNNKSKKRKGNENFNINKM